MGPVEVARVRVPAVDGYELAATVIRPEHGADDWVIVSGAFAVAARFYSRYATALAAAGFGAVAYDYRGIGASRPASLRGFPATMTDWAVLDMAGVTGSMPPTARGGCSWSGTPSVGSCPG
jgi:predicted alpha/beta hydrolase